MQQGIELLNAGGPVMAVLFFISVIALAIILLKVWQFSTSQISDQHFLKAALDAWRAGDLDNTFSILANTRNPTARVLEVAIRGQVEPNLNEDTIREEVTRVAAGHLRNLRAYFRGLEVIATLSPLIGLLGTVIGMIEAFQQLEAAGSRANPAILSGGIWVALLTTAAGLAVAIPTVAVLNWLEGTVEQLRHDMEDAVTQVFTYRRDSSELPASSNTLELNVDS